MLSKTLLMAMMAIGSIAAPLAPVVRDVAPVAPRGTIVPEEFTSEAWKFRIILEPQAEDETAVLKARDVVPRAEVVPVEGVDAEAWTFEIVVRPKTAEEEAVAARDVAPTSSFRLAIKDRDVAANLKARNVAPAVEPVFDEEAEAWTFRIVIEPQGETAADKRDVQKVDFPADVNLLDDDWTFEVVVRPKLPTIEERAAVAAREVQAGEAVEEGEVAEAWKFLIEIEIPF